MFGALFYSFFASASCMLAFPKRGVPPREAPFSARAGAAAPMPFPLIVICDS